MRARRILATVLGIAVASTLNLTIAIRAQSSGDTSSQHHYVAPRTPWGDPDLQGIWPSSEMQGTPLERPANFGTRAALNDEEYAARLDQSKQQAESDGEHYVDPKAPRRGTGIGAPSHWGERGKPSRQASLIVDPADGRLPAMTPAGEQRKNAIRSTYFYDFPADIPAHAFNTFEDLGPYDRCITRGLFASMLPTAYNMGNQIFQFPGHVVIVNEMIHEARVIPLDSTPHVSSKIHQYMGDSRGHWDGDTLVIDSTNFNGKVGLTRNGNTMPVSEKLHITERLTRVSADVIQYEATVSDPDTWVRPWTVSLPLKQNPNYGMYEYACHEGNYGMRNILSGARSDDKNGGSK